MIWNASKMFKIYKNKAKLLAGKKDVVLGEVFRTNQHSVRTSSKCASFLSMSISVVHRLLLSGDDEIIHSCFSTVVTCMMVHECILPSVFVFRLLRDGITNT